MAGILDIARGLSGLLGMRDQRGLLNAPPGTIQRGLLGANPEEVARAMEWRRSVMAPGSPQSPIDERASRLMAMGFTPNDVRGGARGLRESPTHFAKAMEWAGLAPFGITVFHGSPHRFDKFDMSKIGTGEGAQAYGHGLYFAENPQVAKNYAPRDMNYENNLMKMYKSAEARRDYNSMEVLESAMLHQTPNELRAQYPKAGALIDQIAKHQQGANFSLYKVDLPDEQIAKMLDWDKPLSQQPENVKAALQKLGVNPDDYGMLGNAAYGPRDPARVVYGQIAAKLGGSDKASAELSKLGIPGIRYLDQGSRGSGQGTSNFVVFDDSLPKIIGRE